MACKVTRCSLCGIAQNIKKQYDEQKKPGISLTRKMVLAMIESVIIYDEQTIEVKFTFDDIGKRAVEYLNSITL